MSETEPTPCPACRGRLYPKLLACADCGLEVATRYRDNEFAALADEHLHLLRVFVLCEGRIRDMETVLGVSYPTVKARIAELRSALGLKPAVADVSPDAAVSRAAASPAALASTSPADVEREPASVSEILDQLSDGRLSYEAAMARIRGLRARP